MLKEAIEIQLIYKMAGTQLKIERIGKVTGLT